MNKFVRVAIRWLARSTIIVLPASYYVVFLFLIVDTARYTEYTFDGDFKLATTYDLKETKL